MINGTVDLDAVVAFCPYGSFFHLSSTGSFVPNMFWLDLGENSLLSFVDGARFETETHVEVRGETRMDFQLSEISFQTLNVEVLWNGNDVGWSDFSFTVDISEYKVKNGSKVILISAHTQMFFLGSLIQILP